MQESIQVSSFLDPKRILEWFASLSFLIFASFYVLQFEYSEGGFFYYFFKAKLYYAENNKILFPVLFWFCFLLFILLLKFPLRTPIGKKEFLSCLKSALAFHLFLLLLIRSREIVDDFTLIPTNLAALPYVTSYEKAFVLLGLGAYYVLCFETLFKIWTGPNRLFQAFLPLSLFIPFLFDFQSRSNTIAMAGGFFFFISKFFIRGPRLNVVKKFLKNKWFILIFIVLIGTAL